MTTNQKGYRNGKIHYAISEGKRACVPWQIGNRFPNIESTSDWKQVTCKRCLAMQ